MRVKLVAAWFVLAVASSTPVLAADAPPIFIGGAFIRQHAVEDARGHLLVPVRGVFQALHADVTYTPPRYVVVRKNGGVVAGLIVGRDDAVVQNRPRTLGVAPIRRGGRIYVPLRVIAELAGATVVYSANPRLVDIRLPYNELFAPRSSEVASEALETAGIPLWAYFLVGAALLALALEIGRQVSVAARGSARRPLAPGFLPLTPRTLQLPYAPDAGDQHGMGQIRK